MMKPMTEMPNTSQISQESSDREARTIGMQSRKLTTTPAVVAQSSATMARVRVRFSVVETRSRAPAGS
jgi:hypothetical protein